MGILLKKRKVSFFSLIDFPFQVDYFELQSELLQMAVSLQLVTSEKVELSTPGAPEIIALDASTMYAADSSSKPDLRPQLVEPHDSCTVLAQETNGTIFSYSDKVKFLNLLFTFIPK